MWPLLHQATTYVQSFKFTKSQYFLSFVSMLYLGGSLLSSYWYAVFLTPYMSNDFWWHGFNASVHGYLLNAMRTLHMIDMEHGNIDLASALFAQEQSLTSPNSFAYPRNILFTKLTDPRTAIVSCRSSPPIRIVWVITQNCWIDFNKTWEVAHTAARQERCYSRYKHNGAVYLEAILRNTDMSKFMTELGMEGAEFDIGVYRYLMQYETGRAWMASVSLPWRDISVEVAYWRAFNITFWKTQYQNLRLLGIQESMMLFPALSGVHELGIVSVETQSKQALWTTITMSCGLYCDIWYAQSLNASIIRQDESFWGKVADIELILLGASGRTQAQDILHAFVGDINSIDLYYVPVPSAFKQLYFEFQFALTSTCLNHADIAALYDTIDTIEIIPQMHAWTSIPHIQFYGGSLLCNARDPTTYVQREWGYDDGCETTIPLSYKLTRKHLLFANLMILNTSIAIEWQQVFCSQTHHTQSCIETLKRLEHTIIVMKNVDFFFSSSSISSALDAMAVASLEIIQMASSPQGKILLRHSVSNSSEALFKFLVWGMAMDWIEGTREVVSFEGDRLSLNLISYSYERSTPVLVVDSLPHSIAFLFQNGVWYVTMIFLFATCCMISVAAFYSFQVSGHNMLYFNRVAGPIWVGRPLLFLRGLTAILVLSSSSIDLVVQHGLLVMQYTSRSMLDSFIVASETTWVTYVMSDVLLVVTKDSAAWCAPLSALVMFIVAVILELKYPLRMNILLHRDCQVVYLDSTVLCDANSLHSGSTIRALVILGLNAVVVVGMYFITRLWWLFVAHGQPLPLPESFLLYPESSIVFFEQMRKKSAKTEWWIDAASNVMCGMVLFTVQETNYVFDVKSWLLLRLPPARFKKRGSVSTFITPALSKQKINPGNPTSPTTTDIPVTSSTRRHSYLLVIVLLYIFATLLGSILYLSVLQSKMSNDFWWSGFNATGSYRFLGLLFATRPDTMDVELGGFAIFDTFNGTMDAIKYSSAYSMNVQDTDLSSLTAAVRGLRMLDACASAWLPTQYCWVDFERKWSLASTASRQQRCMQFETSNGAVYLESVLRNIDANRFQACWGEAYSLAFGNELEKSPPGRLWTATTLSARLGELQEVAYWEQQNLTEFKLQWQNYYVYGLLETITIKNSFGMEYDLSIKQSHGVWRFMEQTSLKMYWMLACDLTAIQTNQTIGYSLVRGSADYIFQNTTPYTLLIQNGTLASPIEWTGQLLQDTVGPYGSIDLRHIPPPQRVIKHIHDFEQQLGRLLFESTQAAVGFNALPGSLYMNTIPLDWRNMTFHGGNPLCFEMFTDPGYLCPLLGILASCQGNSVQEAYHMTREEGILAALMGNLKNSLNNASICAFTSLRNSCIYALDLFPMFISSHVNSTMQDTRQEAAMIQVDIVAMNISIFQYVYTEQGIPMLATSNAFDLNPFWCWSYLYHWTKGYREVISIHGDASKMVVLTGYRHLTDFTASPSEIPRSLSLYFTIAIEYVTIVLLAIAGVVILYVVIHRGRVEAWNLVKLNRVGGIVWIGRPLLMLRAISAICLLSTSQLHLIQSESGMLAKFHITSLSWTEALQTILISGEVCWLTYILNDLLSVLTKWYTRQYATMSTVLLWSITAIIQLIWPLRVNLTLLRACSYTNFDIVCSVGRLEVGNFSRFLLLLVLLLGCVCVSFFVQVIRQPNPSAITMPSLFLYSLGAYTFTFEDWTIDNILYLDKASAFLNGLVVIGHKDMLYMLDVKTWRSYAIPKANPAAVKGSKRFLDCVPLIQHV